MGLVKRFLLIPLLGWEFLTPDMKGKRVQQTKEMAPVAFPGSNLNPHIFNLPHTGITDRWSAFDS